MPKKYGEFKHSKKTDREKKILLGLVELFLKTGKPIGSNSLKENGFEDVSSATIRNYFAQLENKGYLTQAHSSGGRAPTAKGIKYYADAYAQENTLEFSGASKQFFCKETKEPTAYLNQIAEKLSAATDCAVCLTAPRFDHDFILDVKLVGIDNHRLACILITDFGQVKTEILHAENKFSHFTLKRMEGYFLWQVRNGAKPQGMTPSEEQDAKRFYEEVMLRYIVQTGNYFQTDITRTGFARLLQFPEFHDPLALASGLALFENCQTLRHLAQICQSRAKLTYWIGDDLAPFAPNSTHCSLIAIPYRIHSNIVGAIALLGPMRLAYRRLFALLRHVAESLSDTLTSSLYKYKLQYRQAENTPPYLIEQMKQSSKEQKLLENKKR